jgi:hypothetical protein
MKAITMQDLRDAEWAKGPMSAWYYIESESATMQDIGALMENYVQWRMRQVQCQGCDVPKDGVYQISEPMPADKRALMLSVTAREPFKSQLKECAARIADLESQLEAIGAGGVEPLRTPGTAPSAAPVPDERAAFEAWLGIKPCGAAHDLAWSTWKARAALAATQPAAQGPDAQDAARYRWLRNESWACYNIAKKKPEVALVAVVRDGACNVKMVLAEDAMDTAVDGYWRTLWWLVRRFATSPASILTDLADDWREVLEAIKTVLMALMLLCGPVMIVFTPFIAAWKQYDKRATRAAKKGEQP